MPAWIYHYQSSSIAFVVILAVVSLSILGLLAARRWLLPHFEFHDGVNEAVSGTVQAIGVFYGVTVGLIAVGVWNTSSAASDLVSQEAASIGALYRDVSILPEPQRTSLQRKLRAYTMEIIEVEWPAQREGRFSPVSHHFIRGLLGDLGNFEPATEGEKIRYGEVLTSLNRVVIHRRLRLDAVENGLSSTMWCIIWTGAAISIGVFYLFKIQDVRMHIALVGLVSLFLGLVLFMLIINDRPFYGVVSVPPTSFQSLLDNAMKP